MTKKKFKELNLSNAFLFAAVMADKDACRLMLEMILDRPIGEVTVHTEHNILFNSDYKSVRLDVFASEATQVDYNVEMQNEDVGDLTKRSRFYQAEMDVASLKPGEDYTALKPSYVIFICTYDPFGLGLYRYVFENRCLERDFSLGDGTTKIFLNTKGSNQEEVPKVLVDFLHYVEDSTDACARDMCDVRVRRLHDRITQLKKSRAWEGNLMRLEELLRRTEEKAENRGIIQGEVQGKIQGRTIMLDLIRHMTDNGEADQIPRLTEDSAFLNEMLEKYHLNI